MQRRNYGYEDSYDKKKKKRKTKTANYLFEQISLSLSLSLSWTVIFKLMIYMHHSTQKGNILIDRTFCLACHKYLFVVVINALFSYCDLESCLSSSILKERRLPNGYLPSLILFFLMYGSLGNILDVLWARTRRMFILPIPREFSELVTLRTMLFYELIK